MDPRIARNLLQIMQPQLEQANALLEAARALHAVAYPQPEAEKPSPQRRRPRAKPQQQETPE